MSLLFATLLGPHEAQAIDLPRLAEHELAQVRKNRAVPLGLVADMAPVEMRDEILSVWSQRDVRSSIGRMKERTPIVTGFFSPVLSRSPSDSHIARKLALRAALRSVFSYPGAHDLFGKHLAGSRANEADQDFALGGTK